MKIVTVCQNKIDLVGELTVLGAIIVYNLIPSYA